jgi:hypothetical protein
VIYVEYKAVKYVLKHPGKTESFYKSRRRMRSGVEKAISNRYLEHPVVGYKSIHSDVIAGVLSVRSDDLVVSKEGQKAFDTYSEHRRELLSGRSFSVWMAVVGAVLSIIISVIVNLLFRQPPAP